MRGALGNFPKQRFSAEKEGFDTGGGGVREAPRLISGIHMIRRKRSIMTVASFLWVAFSLGRIPWGGSDKRLRR